MLFAEMVMYMLPVLGVCCSSWHWAAVVGGAPVGTLPCRFPCCVLRPAAMVPCVSRMHVATHD